MREIRGKKALITGGAAGLGRAIAEQLARAGADVYLLDIDRLGLTDAVGQLRSLGVEAIGAYCDVAQPDQISASVQGLMARWGGLDILVNNAGVAYYGPTLSMTAAQWDWILAVNLHAPIQFTRELLPVLLERAEAHILNMASITGLVAGGRFCAYHVSKFGLVGFSEALRAEFGRQGLGVTALCPGPVRTNLYCATPSGHKHKATPTPPRWICTTPERVAAKAVRAIRRDQRLVLVSPLAYTLYYTKRFAPGLLDALQRIGRRRKMRQKEAARAA
ncbi:MAG: short-chain dehydrogenase [Planctomycetes bacterium RBG_16_64_10]|nr:MAG: short-chain dehydrogenase [Planctomycetes bacterium RBG_16_64_10]